ncbi:MAG: M23 family metallopeptidase [Candidatus Spechtbacterales bacterium]
MHAISIGAAVFILSGILIANAAYPPVFERNAVAASETASSVEHSQLFADARSVLGEPGRGGVEEDVPVIAPQDTALLSPGMLPSGGSYPTEDSERNEVTTYTVQEGDTLSAIAARHNLSTNTLLWSNDLGSADLIRPGDELTILPVDGLLHEVRSGDTLSTIAKRYKASADDIIRYNQIEVDTIIIGQHLIIAGGVEPPPAPKSRTVASSGRAASNSLPNISGYFIRPTAGYRSQGIHSNNAVDIANACGTPVYAAASGTVQAASNGGRWNGGYGNFVTIVHPNGVTTLYAHMTRGVVSSGQQVSQGHAIGYMGTTGRSTGCHLHWEVRGARNPLG